MRKGLFIMFSFLKKITQKLLPVSSGLKTVFIVFENVLAKDFFVDWEQREIISAGNLPDRIFAIVIESELLVKVVISKKETGFSFMDFCKEHLAFEYKNPRLENIYITEYYFSAGDIVYFLEKNEEGKYEAYVYESV